MQKSVLVLLLVGVFVCQVFVCSGQIFSDHQCVYETLNINCVTPKTILIDRADYGQYNSCNLSCCLPAPEDCTVDLETNFPDLMLVLRNECDNVTSCAVVVQTQTLPTCPGISQAQYLHVYYRCYPEDPTTEPPTVVTTESTTSSTTTFPFLPPTTIAPDEGLAGGVIAGIVVGVLLFAACVALIVVILYKKFTAPPPKKKRQQAGNQRLQVHHNKGFASEEHIQLSVIDVKTNGIPVHTSSSPANATGTTAEADRPMSDGKRQSRPITAAESFRYAQEKDEILKKFRNQGSDTVDETDTAKKPKSKVKRKKKAVPPPGGHAGNQRSENNVYVNHKSDNSTSELNISKESPHIYANGDITGQTSDT